VLTTMASNSYTTFILYACHIGQKPERRKPVREKAAGGLGTREGRGPTPQSK